MRAFLICCIALKCSDIEDEYDRLTELLRSRTVDLSNEEDNKRIIQSTFPPAGDYETQEAETFRVQERKLESSVRMLSSPGSTLNISEEELASPAEVAKAYMGSRPSKVSPSSLSLRSQMLRETTASPSFAGFPPKSSGQPLSSKAVVRLSGVRATLDNGYTTPVSRGRSAIYRMSRSPYFRAQPTITAKDGEQIEDDYTGPSMPAQWTPKSLALSSGKQVLKRRSSVLESDIGSIGPIRRIRQKSNLVSPLKSLTGQVPSKFLPATNVLDTTEQSSSSVQRTLPLSTVKYDSSDMKGVKNREKRTGYVPVPPQSREMAKKILQQLDKLVPSPKDKSSETKAMFRDESPSKLTLDMLHGQALKSVTENDLSKLFNVDANGKFEGKGNSHSESPGIFSPMKTKAGGNGPSSTTVFKAKVASEAKLMDNISSVAETRTVMGTPDYTFPHSAVEPLQKKSAFKMQAPVDSLEYENDAYTGRDISGPSSSEREIIEMNDHKVGASDTFTTKKLVFSSESLAASKVSEVKVSGKLATNGPAVFDKKDTGFTFQVSLTPSTQRHPPPTPTMTSPAVEKPGPSGGQDAAPLFSFSSKTTPLTFSSSMVSSTEHSNLKFGAKSEMKEQLFGSGPSVSTTATTVAEAEKSDKTQEAGLLFKSVATPSSSGFSMPTTSNTFQFGASSVSTQSNGSPIISSSVFTASSSSAPSIFSSSVTATASGFSTSAASSRSEPSTLFSTSTTTPSFQFGSSSSAVPTSLAGSAAKPVVTDSAPKPAKESIFGLSSSSATASSFTSTGGSLFGFSAPALSGATTFSGSSGSGGAGSLIGSQAAQPGTGASLFAQSTTSQFGSTSSLGFNLAGSSSGSTFKSSISSSKPFGLSPGFGESTVVASSASSGSLASTATAASLFAAGSQSTTPSLFSSGFGSSAPSPSISAFGTSSSASAPAFGSSSASIFSASSAPAMASPVFSFTQAAATTSSSAFGFSSATAAPSAAAALSSAVPTFGALSPTMGFKTASPGNNDQMNVEDSMTDDSVLAASPAVLGFGQAATIPAPTSPFGSAAAASGVSVFQFGSPQSAAFLPGQSPFQPAAGSEFQGSFSMGSGGGDKSGRRFIKAKRDKHRKK
ncbi:unnamed protein product [Spirodela intermedia]|uniref:Uncharacterized protein n=1 Tax=Spirodela intermedia TaxID=51605 RepID=A0A7I8L3Y4_SPIIN|nr:unnamed protein product [Spirodela intermedia]